MENLNKNLSLALIRLFAEYSSIDVLPGITEIIQSSNRMSETLKEIENLPQLQYLNPSIKQSFLRRAESLLKKFWLYENSSGRN